MLPYLKEDFGNPSNTLHAYGWSAENAVKKAAEKVAALLNCKAGELTWNAGATEGNNTVIFGLIRKLKMQNPNESIHIVTSKAEHWSVLSALQAAEKFEKISVTYMPVNNQGTVSVEELQKHIRPETKLVSLIWVNNETGSINPVSELAEFCQKNKIYFHTDGTQAIGKIEIDLQKNPLHFLTFSSHKFCGPKGVGALYMRALNPTVEIEPYLLGGGQQHNRRSGTLNVPAIVGTGIAAEISLNEMADESKRTRELLQNLYLELKAKLPSLQINGPDFPARSPANLSLLMPKMIDLVLPALSSLAFSQGSACQTGEATSSHVLASLGLSPEQAQCTIRLSIGRFTTSDELQKAAKIIISAFKSDLL
jgi:cysteine desulfurase